MGGSNGGLLMGAMLTQRPELFRAVVIQVPLLDMLRYHQLLAGASWMAEYGDPDKPAEAEFLRHISPYHNLRPGLPYPEPLFVTSTKDDRVHPGHARKMAAKMAAMGLPFLYYENVEGGHAAAATLRERAKPPCARVHLSDPETDGLAAGQRIAQGKSCVERDGARAGDTATFGIVPGRGHSDRSSKNHSARSAPRCIKRSISSRLRSSFDG